MSKKRTWSSPTPEAGRVSFAGWLFAKYWDSLVIKCALARGQFSSFISIGVMVEDPEGNTLWSLGNAYWAAVFARLTNVDDVGIDAADKWSLWKCHKALLLLYKNIEFHDS